MTLTNGPLTNGGLRRRLARALVVVAVAASGVLVAPTVAAGAGAGDPGAGVPGPAAVDGGPAEWSPPDDNAAGMPGPAPVDGGPAEGSPADDNAAGMPGRAPVDGGPADGTPPDCAADPGAPGCDQTSSPKADLCDPDDQTSSPRAGICEDDPVDGLSACLDIPVGVDCGPFLVRYGQECAATSVAPWCGELGGILLAVCVAELGESCDPARPGLARFCAALADGGAPEAPHCEHLGLEVGTASEAATDAGSRAVEPVGPGVSSPAVPQDSAAPAGPASPAVPAVPAGPAPTPGAPPQPPAGTPRLAVPPPGPSPTPTATLPPSPLPAGPATLDVVRASSTVVSRPVAPPAQGGAPPPPGDVAAEVEVLPAGVGGARAGAQELAVGRLVAGGGEPLLGWLEVLAAAAALGALAMWCWTRRRHASARRHLARR